MNNSGFNCWCSSKQEHNNCGCKENSHKFYCECEKIENECGCKKQTSGCGCQKSGYANSYEYGNSNSNSCGCCQDNQWGYDYKNSGYNQAGYGWY